MRLVAVFWTKACCQTEETRKRRKIVSLTHPSAATACHLPLARLCTHSDTWALMFLICLKEERQPTRERERTGKGKRERVSEILYIYIYWVLTKKVAKKIRLYVAQET